MSGSEPVPNPERLTEGKLGRLLKNANRDFAADLDQPAAFRRVNERLKGVRMLPLSPRALWLLPAALLGVLGVMVTRAAPVSDAPMLVAEDSRGYLPNAALSASAAAVAELSPEPSLPSPSARSASSKTKRRADLPSTVDSTTAVSVAPLPVASSDGKPSLSPSTGGEAQPALAESPAVTGQDCLSLARLGKTRDAEACFLKRAEGSGLGAEMALYEVARLRRDVLADANGALRALAEYRSRFPTGSLRREADMSQLELLVQLGRSDDALKQSAELLASSASGERAAELHFLRGHILRKSQSKFAAAALEYELAERAGARGGEAKYFRGLCLEALGRASEAAALFAEYLEQPRRTYAEDAKRRLEKLKP